MLSAENEDGALSALYKPPSQADVAEEFAADAAEDSDLAEFQAERAVAVADAIDSGSTEAMHEVADAAVAVANDLADEADGVANEWLEDVAVAEAMNDPDMTPEVADEAAQLAADAAADAAAVKEEAAAQAEADADSMALSLIHI